jgi:hydroxyacylglutathione hydrolase
LLARDGECVVVDVPPDPRAVVDRMAELAVEPVAVALTHGHADHAGGVAALLDAVGRPLPVHVHPGDRELVLHRDGGDALAAAVAGLGTPPAELLVPHTTLWLGDVAVRPVRVPGHTRGSTCLVVEGTARALLLTGDALFAGGTGRCDLPGGRRPQAERSLRDLLVVMDDDVVVLPGHGPTTTVGAERIPAAGPIPGPAPAPVPGPAATTLLAGDVRRMPHRRAAHGGAVPTRWASGRC